MREFLEFTKCLCKAIDKGRVCIHRSVVISFEFVKETGWLEDDGEGNHHCNPVDLLYISGGGPRSTSREGQRGHCHGEEDESKMVQHGEGVQPRPHPGVRGEPRRRRHGLQRPVRHVRLQLH